MSINEAEHTSIILDLEFEHAVFSEPVGSHLVAKVLSHVDP